MEQSNREVSWFARFKESFVSPPANCPLARAVVAGACKRTVAELDKYIAELDQINTEEGFDKIRPLMNRPLECSRKVVVDGVLHSPDKEAVPVPGKPAVAMPVTKISPKQTSRSSEKDPSGPSSHLV